MESLFIDDKPNDTKNYVGANDGLVQNHIHGVHTAEINMK